jgi:hypothetical protein
LQQRAEGRHLAERCIEVERRARVMLHAGTLSEIRDRHVARSCHKSDMLDDEAIPQSSPAGRE